MDQVSYKTTELGLVPSDWEILLLNGNFDFFQNNTYARNCLNPSKGVVQNIHYGDVLVKFGAILDCDRDDIPFVNPEIPINFAKRLVQSGDIIIADTAEDNTVGKAIEVVNVGNKKVVSGLHTVFVRPHSGLFSERFLGYFINSAVYHDQLLPFIVGTKVSSVSKGALQETSVLRPPLPEQRAIASALSDVDGYIAALERLIAKKRNIKQGAMQELLTGRRRLLGFSGEWVDVELGTQADILRGGSPRPIQAYLTTRTDGINWIKIGDVALNAKYILSTEEHIVSEGAACSRRVSKGDFLLSNSMSFGRPYILNIDGCIHDGWLTIQNYQANFDTDFLYYILGSEVTMRQYINMAAGSSVQNLNKEKVQKVVVCKPPKPEQAAIAAILSDMDSEIDALTARLDKMRNIKQGMMQELLTGRIRLVAETEQAEAVPPAKPVIKCVELPKHKPKTTVAQTGRRNKAIEDAVVLAVVADLYATDQYPLTPFYAQKFPYLLHRHMEGVAQGYHKLAAGPYNAELKYKTALPIAKKNKYVVARKSKYMGTSYEAMLVGDNIGQAKKYFAQWHGDEPLKWLEQFRYIKNRRDELELLSTVDMAMVELRAAGVQITMQAVKEIIQASAEWEAKLKREIFSDANIDRAIEWSNRLFEQGG